MIFENLSYGSSFILRLRVCINAWFETWWDMPNTSSIDIILMDYFGKNFINVYAVAWYFKNEHMVDQGGRLIAFRSMPKKNIEKRGISSLSGKSVSVSVSRQARQAGGSRVFKRCATSEAKNRWCYLGLGQARPQIACDAQLKGWTRCFTENLMKKKGGETEMIN